MDLAIMNSNFQLLIVLPILNIGINLTEWIPVQWTGFFCDDDEIRYPLKSDTIPYFQMQVFYCVFGFLLVLMSEYSSMQRFSGSNYRQTLSYIGLQTIIGNHIWIVLAYFVGCKGLEYFVNIAKRTTSRLRPDFLGICQPVNLTILCSDDSNVFVEFYTCGRNIIDEEFLSFPSGHTAYCSFVSTFIIMYLHRRCKVPFKTKQFLQFLLATIAVGIAFSRVRDNKHRLSDVIGGGLIGISSAVFYTKMMLNNFDLLKFPSDITEEV